MFNLCEKHFQVLNTMASPYDSPTLQSPLDFNLKKQVKYNNYNNHQNICIEAQKKCSPEAEHFKGNFKDCR